MPSTVDMTSIYNMTEYEMSTQEPTTTWPEVTRHPLNTALLYIILFFGVPSNLSIIYLVVTVKQLRNLSNVILCLMCIGDFLMVVVIAPLELLHLEAENALMMNLILAFNFFICGLSVFSLMMLSYDRHKAVTRPLEAEQTFKSNVIKVSVIVFLSALVAVPNYFFIIENADGGYYKEHWKFLVPSTFLILYLFPLLSIAVLYTHMAITLTADRKRVGESIKRNSKIGQQRNRTAAIILCLVVVFSICWFPFFYSLLHSTFFFVNQHAFQNFNYNWKIIFCLMNSVFDPISIYVLGTRYRHHLVRTLPFRIVTCCKTRKESTTESTMQSMLTSAGSYYRPTTRININKDDV